MILKRNLSPRRVLAYTGGPLLWATGWAVAAPLLVEITDDERLVLPFAPIAALAASLAIFIAFRNNTSFGRWVEARAAWQSILVASRVIARQVFASTGNAVAEGNAEQHEADRFRIESAHRLIAFARLLAGSLRGETAWAGIERLVGAQECDRLRSAANPADLVLQNQAVEVKSAIRRGLLGQFDPISLEPQMSALSNAQGTVERIKSTPTPRQYEFFTRRIIQLFAVLAPFGILSLVPTQVWWTTPLAVCLSGVFIIMSIVGTANEDPFEGHVTDVPLEAICTELERDVLDKVGESEIPAEPIVVDGYLW